MIRRLSQGLLCLCLLLPGLAYGHELLPGYLELTETSPQVYDVLWKLPLQRGAKLPLAPRFPQDCAQDGNLETRLERRALVYRAELSCQSSLQGRTVSIDGLRSVGTDVLLRLVPLDGSGTQTTLIQPEMAQVQLESDSSDAQQTSAITYLRLGIEHILLGVDHLLFVLGLLFGFGNGSTMELSGLLPQDLFGVIVAVSVIVLLVSAQVAASHRQWICIVFRGAGSWIAAAGLLALGLQFKG